MTEYRVCASTAVCCVKGSVLFSFSSCAAKKWIFQTCGAVGPEGPTSTQCLNFYKNSNVNVTVGTQGPFKGIQMWQVQESGTYRYSCFAVM